MFITSSTFKSLGFLTANSAPSKPKLATFLILSLKSSLKAKAENFVEEVEITILFFHYPLLPLSLKLVRFDSSNLLKEITK